MRFTILSAAAFVVASILVLDTAEATRCKCTSNGFNSDSSSGVACCQKLGGKVLRNVFNNFIGCDSGSLGANYDAFNGCCKEYNPNLYRG
ncbi:hypothetical protein BGZ47_009232, partial [Haplosporangium gracile]